MFVQVITGKTSQPAQVRAALDRWVEQLAPGATGWLGSTAGVTEDGRLVALARFESEGQGLLCPRQIDRVQARALDRVRRHPHHLPRARHR